MYTTRGGGGLKPVLLFMAYFYYRTRIPTLTRIPVLYKYYGKGIRVWIRTNVKSFCTLLCNHMVWNPSPSPIPTM